MADALRSVYATPQPNSACATVIRGADDGRSFPVIDISGPRAEVVADLDDALRRWGGFVCVGHSLDNGLMKRMLEAAYAFFALPDDVKSKVDLVQGGGGAAWRGYMPIGGEIGLWQHRGLQGGPLLWRRARPEESSLPRRTSHMGPERAPR